MARTKKKKKSRRDDVGGLAFVGCLFIGLALGIALGNAAVGVLAGLGCGFIAQALVKTYMKN